MGRMKDKVTGHYDGKEYEYVHTTTTNSTQYTGPINPNDFTIKLPKGLQIDDQLLKGQTVNCTLCKVELHINSFKPLSGTYNSPKITYKGTKFTRHICEGCYSKALDKLFGINGESEEVLFKEDK